MKEVNKLANNRIEISKTSTGKVSYSVKAYGDKSEDIEGQLEKLIRIAEDYKTKLEMV